MSDDLFLMPGSPEYNKSKELEILSKGYTNNDQMINELIDMVVKDGSGAQSQGSFLNDGAGWNNFLSSGYGFSSTGVILNPLSALRVAAVIACIKRIAQDIAKVSMKLLYESETGWQVAKKHPLARLLRKPNKRDTLYSLIYNMMVAYLLAGNAYLAIILDEASGRPTQLIHTIPGAVTVRENDYGDITYQMSNRLFWGLKTTDPKERGPVRHFDADEVIHLKHFSLDGNIRGLSPLTIGAEVIGIALAAQQTAAQTFKDGATVPFAITTPEGTPIEKALEILAVFNKNNAGLKNAGKGAVLMGGADIKPTTLSPKESQLIEVRDQQLKEIARMYLMPPSLIGIKEGNSYNSFEAEMLNYIDSTLMPIIVPLCQEFGMKLLFEDEQDFYKFDIQLEDIAKADKATQMTTYQTAFINGFMNRNEIREKLGYGKVEDGEEFYVPLNTGVTGQASAQPGGLQGDNKKKETTNESQGD
jgi:HK97 family phage portal protein